MISLQPCHTWRACDAQAQAKLFTTFYIIVGMGVLGVVAGSLGSYVGKKITVRAWKTHALRSEVAQVCCVH